MSLSSKSVFSVPSFESFLHSVTDVLSDLQLFSGLEFDLDLELDIDQDDIDQELEFDKEG